MPWHDCAQAVRHLSYRRMPMPAAPRSSALRRAVAPDDSWIPIDPEEPPTGYLSVYYSDPLARYPVWAWHWASTGAWPWSRLRRIDLDPATRDAKRAAIAAYRSQIAPLLNSGDDLALRIVPS